MAEIKTILSVSLVKQFHKNRPKFVRRTCSNIPGWCDNLPAIIISHTEFCHLRRAEIHCDAIAFIIEFYLICKCVYQGIATTAELMRIFRHFHIQRFILETVAFIFHHDTELPSIQPRNFTCHLMFCNIPVAMLNRIDQNLPNNQSELRKF